MYSFLKATVVKNVIRLQLMKETVQIAQKFSLFLFIFEKLKSMIKFNTPRSYFVE